MSQSIRVGDLLPGQQFKHAGMVWEPIELHVGRIVAKRLDAPGSDWSESFDMERVVQVVMLGENDVVELGAVDAPRKPRGFAALPPEARRAISSRAGKAAHAKGAARVWTSAAASAAAKVAHDRGIHNGFKPETAREAGRRGGLATARRRAAQAGGEP